MFFKAIKLILSMFCWAVHSSLCSHPLISILQRDNFWVIFKKILVQVFNTIYCPMNQHTLKRCCPKHPLVVFDGYVLVHTLYLRFTPLSYCSGVHCDNQVHSLLGHNVFSHLHLTLDATILWLDWNLFCEKEVFFHLEIIKALTDIEGFHTRTRPGLDLTRLGFN